MGKLLGRAWVGGTLSLICFIGYSSQLCVVLPSYRWDWTNRDLWNVLVPFNALLVLLLVNYALTVGTDPGRVPEGWEPDWRQLETGEMEVRKQTGGPRFCRSCRAYKPPRAHHCRQCKRCVLKMDHHCPWVNNCVGHHNYGHFVRFLFFVDIACAYHLWMISTHAFHSLDFFITPSTFQIVMLILNYTACVPVIIAVGVFSLYHLWSLLVNTTTIEGWEKDKAASLMRRGKIREYRYPYHLGYLSNVRAVLGSNPLLWCWPQRARGDGLSYPVAVGTEPKDQLAWPPRDTLPSSQQQRRRKARPPPPPDQAFTYGSGLNPDLVPGGAGSTRLRPTARRRAPYQDDEHHSSGASESSASNERDDEDDEDDIPLHVLAVRRTREALAAAGASADAEEVEADEAAEEEQGEEDLDPRRAVRIRRGSEGFEIRPRWAAAARAEEDADAERRRSSASDGGSESWEHVGAAEDETEWEIDDEGDRRRVGPRYRYYVREEDSESDTDGSSLGVN